MGLCNFCQFNKIRRDIEKRGHVIKVRKANPLFLGLETSKDIFSVPKNEKESFELLSQEEQKEYWVASIPKRLHKCVCDD